ncbi:MG2 domain-containing protein [Rhodopirellula sp. MGV]|uniref:MG2 domain-containing protein n=1 Tax=Rhodopirellula sp. MGV TaxID=2023130 RepID=UPI000B96A9CB|nr:MG2 domain-containing protein [Rhodopirellula sp. MGV]OYP35040.1 hypothetical protein CGZ80_13625 [Rhodopirellula sp. MGV]PNY35793.1 hypothetical protein C2E31_16310 [Rhodopirellula baltica]
MNLNQPSKQDSPNDDELKQLLLELHYGLLDDDEAETLRGRIETESDVATCWAETLVMVGKIAQAAKLDASNEPPVGVHSSPSVDYQFVGTPVSPPLDETSEPESSVTPPRSRFVKLWLVSFVTAAVVLIAVSGIGHWKKLPARPEDPFHLVVKPVVGDESTGRNEFLVIVNPNGTTEDNVRVGGGFDTSAMPIVPASISFQVLSRGTVLFSGKAETSADHPARIQIPNEVVIPIDAKLEIDAWTGRSSDRKVRLSVPLEPTRCLTYLRTDRPVYRPGEQVFFRSVTLNRQTMTSQTEVPIRYELVDPSGSLVSGAANEGVTERGVGNGVFQIPETAVGGTYKVVAKSLDGFFPDQAFEIEVRRYRAVRLKTDLQFAKRSYTAGDRVSATVSVRRANDEIPVGAAARIQAIVDEQTIYQSTATVELDGTIAIEFDLPSFLRAGEGNLSIAIDDGSVTETAARPIPIHTGRVEVDFFPEGGYLVAGLDNRVYFAARDTHGKPIELAGEVLSQAGRVVATVETLRDGMGKFEFKPEVGMRYSLRVTKPLDISQTPWLPTAVEDKPVMETGSGVFASGESIAVSIRSLQQRRCVVRAVCRGELIGVKTIDLDVGETNVIVPVQERASGVIRVTVLEADTENESTTPLVERLVYRRGTKQLKIATTLEDGDGDRTPGEPVRMTIAVTDENDAPVPGAVLGVSVVDDAALSLRQHELPSIKTHFYLTSEVESPEDLEHADIYLSDEPQAAVSLDLLLGTQGWRRFVSGNPEQFNETFRDALVRLLELDGQRKTMAGQSRSNAETLRSQLIAYRIRANEIWHEFLADVRFTLMLIGFIWLIVFFLRPRKSFAPAVGPMLLLAITLIGCGQKHPSVDSRANRQAFSDAAPKQAGNQPGAAMNVDQGRKPDPQGDEAAEIGSGPSFARRVINVFIPRSGQSAKAPDGAGIEHQITDEQLRQFAKSRGIDTQAIADKLMEELRFPIRQYSHFHRPSEDGVRSDFAELLYWNPLMVTDSTGTASIRFDLSDSLTMFKVEVEGHTSNGRLGSGSGSVTTKVPLEIDAKVPLEVTGGDRIDLPVGLVNSGAAGGEFQIELVTGTALKSQRDAATIQVDSGGRTQERFSISVEDLAHARDTPIRLAVRDASHSSQDSIERLVRVVPDGYPFTTSASGMLVKSSRSELKLPDQIRTGSLRGTIQLMPGTQSQISRGLDSLLREPRGCFEQASSTNYPNVMAFQLMQVDGVVADSERRRIESLLRRGYRKLTSYECRDLGYEWFGNDPGHEALSAFGLMQFAEMAKFIDVDQTMMQRTREWLLGRRDGMGGFERNPRHLHAWSVDQNVVNAYVLWALSEADIAAGDGARTANELDREIDHLENAANTSSDAYLIALSAITLQNVGRQTAAQQLRDRLIEMQQASGQFEGQTTITQSGGLSRTVETTSLAIMAMHSDPAKLDAIRRASDWLLANRRGGGFGSTQATVLALKALVKVHQQIRGVDGGQIQLLINGEVQDTIEWRNAGRDGIVYELPGESCSLIESDSTPTIELRSSDEAALPFVVELSGQTRSPQSDPDCVLDLSVDFANKPSPTEVVAGDSINVRMELTNRSTEGQPMSVAVIGLPGGIEPVIESLDAKKRDGVIDYYELRGREVVLYWRTLAPQESKELSFTCVAQIPGQYTAPASRAYLYYTAERKFWHPPLAIDIR